MEIIHFNIDWEGIKLHIINICTSAHATTNIMQKTYQFGLEHDHL